MPPFSRHRAASGAGRAGQNIHLHTEEKGGSGWAGPRPADPVTFDLCLALQDGSDSFGNYLPPPREPGPGPVQDRVAGLSGPAGGPGWMRQEDASPQGLGTEPREPAPGAQRPGPTAPASLGRAGPGRSGPDRGPTRDSAGTCRSLINNQSPDHLRGRTCRDHSAWPLRYWSILDPGVARSQRQLLLATVCPRSRGARGVRNP